MATLVLAAGGTGGHLFPALAIADQIRLLAPEIDLVFVGTPDHLEARMVPAAGYRFLAIEATGLPRRPGPEIIRFAWLLARGVLKARRLLAELDPAIVVGCGAYVSVPAMLAARTAGIPTYVAESNGHPGLANRLIGRLADRIAVALPGTERFFPAARAICLGNPIRADFTRLDRDQARRELDFAPTDKLLVVTGGSLGARSLNEAFAEARDAVLARPDWSVLHIAGPNEVAAVAQQAGAIPVSEGLYEGAGGRYRLMGFCDRMPAAIVAADLLVSRSGATTVSEIAAAGRPAIFVPLAINPDQMANARFMTDRHAADLVPNVRARTALGPAIAGLIDSPERLARMAAASASLGRPDAARDIALDILRLARLSPPFPASASSG